MAEIERTMLGDVAAIVIAGEFDLADESAADLAVDFVLGQEIRSMLVDLTGCYFMDSTGLRTLLRTNERAVNAGTRVAIAGANPRVGRLFELTGVGKELALYPDRDAALAALRDGAGSEKTA